MSWFKLKYLTSKLFLILEIQMRLHVHFTIQIFIFLLSNSPKTVVVLDRFRRDLSVCAFLLRLILLTASHFETVL